MNLRNLHSFRYNGLIRNKAIGISAASDNKGIVLSYKTKKLVSFKSLIIIIITPAFYILGVLWGNFLNK